MVSIKRKYQSEILDIGIDFSYNMEETDTITNASVEATDKDGNDVTANVTNLMGVSGQRVIIRLHDGIPKEMYNIKVEVDTNTGEHYEVNFVLEIIEDIWEN